MRTMLAASALALVAASPAFAQTADDRLAIIGAAQALDTHVDAKDWPAARSVFTDEIEFKAGDAEVQTMSADDLIGMWSTNLYEGKPSFHLRGNYVVSFDGPEAGTLKSKGYAWNKIEGFEGGDLWEVWGDYTYRVVKDGDEWKLASFAFAPVHQRGNAKIPGHVPEGKAAD